MAATLVGVAVVVGIGDLNRRLHAAELTHLGSKLPSSLFVLCGCIALPAAQALALSRLKKHAWHWIAVMAIPLAISLLARGIAASADGANSPWVGVAAIGLVVLPTLAQWLLVRRWVEGAWLWAPACLLALAGGALGANFATKAGTNSRSAALLGLALVPYALVQALMLKGLPRKAAPSQR